MFVFNRFVIITAAAVQGGLGLDLRRFGVKNLLAKWRAQNTAENAQTDKDLRDGFRNDIKQIINIIDQEHDVEVAQSVSILDSPVGKVYKQFHGSDDFKNKTSPKHIYLMSVVMKHGKVATRTIRDLLQKLPVNVQEGTLKHIAPSFSAFLADLKTDLERRRVGESSFLQPNQYWDKDLEGIDPEDKNTSCLTIGIRFIWGAVWFMPVLAALVIGALCDFFWWLFKSMWPRKWKFPFDSFKKSKGKLSFFDRWFIPFLRKFLWKD